MSRALLIIANEQVRARAASWVQQAKIGTRITFAEAKRSTEQNAKLWACLTDVATQVPWHGIRLTPDDWKLLFMSALGAELRLVPNLDNTGFVNLGRSSSALTKGEMSNLIELILAFGADPAHPVIWSDPKERAERVAA